MQRATTLIATLLTAAAGSTTIATTAFAASYPLQGAFKRTTEAPVMVADWTSSDGNHGHYEHDFRDPASGYLWMHRTMTYGQVGDGQFVQIYRAVENGQPYAASVVPRPDSQPDCLKALKAPLVTKMRASTGDIGGTRGDGFPIGYKQRRWVGQKLTKTKTGAKLIATPGGGGKLTAALDRKGRLTTFTYTYGKGKSSLKFGYPAGIAHRPLPLAIC